MLEKSEPRLPKFLKSEIDENNELYKLAHDGLDKKISIIKNNVKNFNEKKYKDRLAYEINIIKKTGYSGYFLIVSDFISWAKKKIYLLDLVEALALVL